MKLFKSPSNLFCSLIILPITGFSAVAIYTSSGNGGTLVMEEVDVDGAVFLDNVSLRLDFSNGTFEILGFSDKPATISATPLQTTEEQNIKMDFMGCTRSGRNEVTCHVKLTSLGGLDRLTRVVSSWAGYTTQLFDDQGKTYTAVEVTVGNLQGSLVDQLLVAGVPTLAKFKFIDVSPSASTLSLFKPGFYNDANNTAFFGDFRNIDF